MSWRTSRGGDGRTLPMLKTLTKRCLPTCGGLCPSTRMSFARGTAGTGSTQKRAEFDLRRHWNASLVNSRSRTTSTKRRKPSDSESGRATPSSSQHPGTVYRSLAQIRFRADPDWSADERTITVVAIMLERHDREAERREIGQELDQELNKIQWSSGYEWGEPKFILGTPAELSAEDVISSRRGDFDFLCY